jgi:hypothetical protein
MQQYELLLLEKAPTGLQLFKKKIDTNCWENFYNTN